MTSGSAASWQMRAVGVLMRATRKRRFAAPSGGRALLSRPKTPSTPPDRVARKVDLDTRQVRGFDVHVMRPPGAPVDDLPVAVYLHGGAYVNEIVTQHWDFALALVRELGVEVWVPIYGLAPQHDAQQARALVAELLGELREQDRAYWLAGDSAGAALALIGAQDDVARPGSRLRGVTAMAPWLDLRMTNPELDAAERDDPWLARAALHEVATVWAAGTPLEDPGVSPLFGPMAGLPPVDLWVGTRDLTHPDCRLLAQALRAAGVEVDHHEVPGAIHVFALLPVPEGRAAARAMRLRIGRGLSSGTPAS